MRYKKIDNSLFINNRRNFVKQMKENSAAIFFSSDQYPRNGDQYFPYRQNSTFFYLTGIEQEKSILLIAPGAGNEKLREALFLLKPEKMMETWEGHKLTKEDAAGISGINNIFWLEDFDVSLKEVLSETNDVYLNSNEYIKFIPEVPLREERMAKKLKEDYPLHHYHRAAPLITKQRLIKSKEEIELMKKACAVTKDAFVSVLKTIKPGMKEYEVEAEITYRFLKNGANGHGYAPIVAGGKNACTLHYIENDKPLHDGDLVLMDFGAEYANYSADLSRTIPVNGKFSERQKACYNAVLRVMKEVKKMYVPGNTTNNINNRTNELMEAEMIGLGLFTKSESEANPDLYKKYFMHGTAHFLGLDVHDAGSKNEPLKPGMVLTCEPGLYIEEENPGIRIENDILITDGEPEDLMAGFPIEPEKIEELMKK